VEKRAILVSVPTGTVDVSIDMDRPLLKNVLNQAVNLYPGYDGSITECDTKFANRINFGGHAYMPNINPAVKAIKPKSASGGKKL
jgi:hypothetical protein